MKKVQTLIDNKLLTFKKDDPHVDILIISPDNDEIKGSPKPL